MLAAIETSFDDAGVALGDTAGRPLASLLSSQIEQHQPYQGVVPELAARTHVADLPRLWRSLTDADQPDLTAIGVTAGPGLPGSLLAGVNFARGLAAWHGAPLYGLNHLEGHIFSPFMPASNPERTATPSSGDTLVADPNDGRAGSPAPSGGTAVAATGSSIPYPHLALIVSGGHTELFLVHSLLHIELLAQTRDDAVGELLDKVSALLGHGYPGGAKLERLAAGSGLLDRQARFTGDGFLPVPLRGNRELAFSYSGLKTAVVRRVRQAESESGLDTEQQGQLLACLFSVVLDSLWEKVRLALEQVDVAALTVSGGVAINGLLRSRFAAECARIGLPLHFPQPRHCLDNAEMMVWLLGLRLAAGVRPSTFDIQSNWLPGQRL